jgi:hypothetical protein
MIVPVTSLVANETIRREIFCGADALGPLVVAGHMTAITSLLSL